MHPIRSFVRVHLLALAVAAPLGGCTVVTLDSEDGPVRIESRGLIEGHAAVGIPDEDRIFHVKVLDGRSSGAVGEIVLWKLFRLEVGLAGAAIGIGPFDLALGTLFYDPRLPRYRKPEARPQGEQNADQIDEHVRGSQP